MKASYSQVRITIRYVFASNNDVQIIALKKSFQTFFFVGQFFIFIPYCPLRNIVHEKILEKFNVIDE